MSKIHPTGAKQRHSQQLQEVFCTIGGQKNFRMVCTNVNIIKLELSFPESLPCLFLV